MCSLSECLAYGEKFDGSITYKPHKSPDPPSSGCWKFPLARTSYEGFPNRGFPSAEFCETTIWAGQCLLKLENKVRLYRVLRNTNEFRV